MSSGRWIQTVTMYLEGPLHNVLLSSDRRLCYFYIQSIFEQLTMGYVARVRSYIENDTADQPCEQGLFGWLLFSHTSLLSRF